MARDRAREAAGVSPEMAQRWLMNNGWNRATQTMSGASLWIYRPNSQTDVVEQALLPTDRQSDDFVLRMQQFALAVSHAMGIEPGAVLDSLLTIPFDIIRIRSAQEVGYDGSIPLDGGIQLFSGVRQLVIAAAKATHERRPVFGRRNYGQARRFLANARLGQTDVGSYVITVESPVPALDDDLETPRSLGLVGSTQRAVVETLMRSLLAARSAAAAYEESGEVLGFQEGVAEGISAEFCDALIILNDSDERSYVSVEVEWSPFEPQAVGERSDVTFSSADVPGLREASRVLRLTAVEPRMIVVGRVEALSRAEAESTTAGTATIAASFGLRRGAKVRALLSGDDHATAIEAYDSGELVELAGDLVRHGNRSWLLNGRLRTLGEHPQQFE